MVSTRCAAILLFILGTALAQTASAQDSNFYAGAPPATLVKRFALTIGISSYARLPRLRNPANDARKVSATLAKYGFDIVELTNDDDSEAGALANLRQKIIDFRELAKAPSGTSDKRDNVVFIYFAGHGVSHGTETYLVPEDYVPVSDWDDATASLYSVTDLVKAVRKIHAAVAVIFIDACRNDPSEDELSATSFPQGTQINSPQLDLAAASDPNVLIYYSTGPGAPASDGTGDTGPFARHLAAAVDKYHGVSLSNVMGMVGALLRSQSVNQVGKTTTNLFYIVPTEKQFKDEQSAFRGISPQTESAYVAYQEAHPGGYFYHQAAAQLQVLRDGALPSQNASVVLPTTIRQLHPREKTTLLSSPKGGPVAPRAETTIDASDLLYQVGTVDQFARVVRATPKGAQVPEGFVPLDLLVDANRPAPTQLWTAEKPIPASQIAGQAGTNTIVVQPMVNPGLETPSSAVEKAFKFVSELQKAGVSEDRLVISSTPIVGAISGHSIIFKGN